MSFITNFSLFSGWLSRRGEVRKAFVEETATMSRKDSLECPGGAEHPYTEPVAQFAAAIRGDSYMRGLFEKVFLQANTDPKWVDPNYIATDFETLLHRLDVIIQRPPAYYKPKREDGSVIKKTVTMPMFLVFDLLSNTSAAYDLFRYDPFNVALKGLLDAWGAYLKSPASTTTLTTGPGGWFSPEAMADFVPYIEPLTFEATFICPDPSAENKGFRSWDAFFTRELQPSARPVMLPDNPHLIHAACESTTLRIATNVRVHDTFWLKGQNYSLYDMLGGNAEDAQEFAGGTVYHAHLCPLDYHRWHSPIDGIIAKVVVLPGTYYAVLPDDGAPADDPNLEKWGPRLAISRCEPWLTASAARALIFIRATNPAIGLMCFIGVGMIEVSTTEVTVEPGQRVSIGDQLGMFHFGGSAYVLIFGPQVKILFENMEGRPVKPNDHHWVNAVIGKVAEQ